MLSCQYLIIGAGSTGIKVADTIAATGAQVILVDKAEIGGSIPYVDGFLDYLQTEARTFGQSLARFKDFPETFTVLRNYRKKIWRDGLKQVQKQQLELSQSIAHHPNLKIIQGEASFFSKSIVEVNGGKDERHLIQFNECIITTGKNYYSKATEYDLDTVFSIDTLYQLNIVPAKVGIIGVTEQNLSIAGIFAQLGVKVYIFDKLKPSQVLPNMDRSAFNYIIKELATWQVEFHFKTPIIQIEKQPRITILKDKNGNEHKVSIAYLGATKSFDNKNLNLGKISIKATKLGIPTTPTGRTIYKNIWSLGESSTSTNPLNKQRVIQNYLDKLSTPTTSSTHWLNFNSTNNEEFADPRKTDYTAVELDSKVLTIGLPEHEAVKRYGSTFGSSFYQKKGQAGFIKLLYKLSMKQLIGISLTGQASTELELVCFEWFKRGASSDYIDSYLKRLGYIIR